jgi:hypothetical protein
MSSINTNHGCQTGDHSAASAKSVKDQPKKTHAGLGESFANWLLLRTRSFIRQAAFVHMNHQMASVAALFPQVFECVI